MSLKLKFNIVIAAAFVLGLALAGLVVGSLTQAAARRAALSDAATMMGAVNATVTYTEHQVTPLLARSMKVQFIPQSIPFFAAQQTFDALARQRPDYTLRQPVLNPTNPKDRAVPWETDIIRTFQAQPQLQTLTTERQTEAGQILSLSQPVRVTSECLACHSTPERAPASMVDVYGRDNGFGWTVGSVIGAQIVSVPERVTLARSRASLLRIMTALTVVFIVVLGLLNLLLDRLIISPVRRISHTADEVSLGNLDGPEFDARANDEIGSLARSFNRMRRSLVAAFGMLEER